MLLSKKIHIRLSREFAFCIDVFEKLPNVCFPEDCFARSEAIPRAHQTTFLSSHVEMNNL